MIKACFLYLFTMLTPCFEPNYDFNPMCFDIYLNNTLVVAYNFGNTMSSIACFFCC